MTTTPERNSFEGLAQLIESLIEALDTKFDSKFAVIDAKFEAMDAKFDTKFDALYDYMSDKFTRIDEHFAKTDSDIAELKMVTLDSKEDLVSMGYAVD